MLQEVTLNKNQQEVIIGDMNNENKKVDMVSHPPHYEGSTSLECIECMRLIFGDKAVFYFCLCNAFKYMWRYKNKNGEEDVNKTQWYLDYVGHEIEVNGEYVSEEIKQLHNRLTDLYIHISDKIANGL